MTIDREDAVFVESSFEVQILDATVNLIARQPVFLFELRAVAARDDSADCELNPVLVLFGLFFCCRRGLAIALTGAHRSDGKTSRANQHEQSRRAHISKSVSKKGVHLRTVNGFVAAS